jgi:hypothetical protein
MIPDEKELKLSSAKLQQDRFYHRGLLHLRASYPFATILKNYNNILPTIQFRMNNKRG